MKLVLASGSPRRSELLSRLGYDFDVVPSGVDESSMLVDKPVDLARRLARAKVLDVADSRPGDILLGADTVVVHQRDVYGKPADAAEARRMLRRLCGRQHNVITALALLRPGRVRPDTAHVLTRVTLRPYTDEEVEATITAGHPFDKAGAYAIQDRTFQPVASYEGCYCNVVGLPLWAALGMLVKAGVTPRRPPDLLDVCNNCPHGDFGLVEPDFRARAAGGHNPPLRRRGGGQGEG
jgi:septum formation protein